MKLRGYHLRDHDKLTDTNFDFSDNDNGILDVIYIKGDNGSGKSFVLGSVAHMWRTSIMQNGHKEIPFSGGMIRADFEHDKQIVSIHSRNRVTEQNMTLKKLSTIDFGTADSSPKIRNSIIFYDDSRDNLVRSTVSGSVVSGSTSSVFSTLFDLHKRDIEDSVILIDDWDRGLDSTSAKDYYRYLTSHILSKGNQLVLSSCRGYGFIPDCSTVSLSCRVDPIQSSVRLFRDSSFSARGKG